MAFNNSRKLLCEKTLLNFPNYNDIFYIHKDASINGIGAIFSQSHVPLYFYSSNLMLHKKSIL